MPDGPASYVPASDLADYAFCPRSHWYRHHPPPGGPAADAELRQGAGRSAHESWGRAERRHESYRALYWALIAVGLLVIVGGILAWR